MENKQISGKFGRARELGGAAANPETGAQYFQLVNIFIWVIFSLGQNFHLGNIFTSQYFYLAYNFTLTKFTNNLQTNIFYSANIFTQPIFLSS